MTTLASKKESEKKMTKEQKRIIEETLYELNEDYLSAESDMVRAKTISRLNAVKEILNALFSEQIITRMDDEAFEKSYIRMYRSMLYD